MNAQTQRVGVLAVMRAVAEFGVSAPEWHDMPKATDAVAELIEAVKLGGDMPKKEGSQQAGLFFTADNAARLRYAIVRAGGTP